MTFFSSIIKVDLTSIPFTCIPVLFDVYNVCSKTFLLITLASAPVDLIQAGLYRVC